MNSHHSRPFILFLAVSLILHVILVILLIVKRTEDLKTWGGGQSGPYGAVTMIRITPSNHEGEIKKKSNDTSTESSEILLKKTERDFHQKSGHQSEQNLKSQKDKMKSYSNNGTSLFSQGDSNKNLQAGLGEGDSPTPAGGQGQGYDDAHNPHKEPEVLEVIRQKILKVQHYPEAAYRMGIQGLVLLKFQINLSGKISEIVMIQSSGSDVLDQEAMATVRRAEPYPYYEQPLVLPLEFYLQH